MVGLKESGQSRRPHLTCLALRPRLRRPAARGRAALEVRTLAFRSLSMANAGRACDRTRAASPPPSNELRCGFASAVPQHAGGRRFSSHWHHGSSHGSTRGSREQTAPAIALPSRELAPPPSRATRPRRASAPSAAADVLPYACGRTPPSGAMASLATEPGQCRPRRPNAPRAPASPPPFRSTRRGPRCSSYSRRRSSAAPIVARAALRSGFASTVPQQAGVSSVYRPSEVFISTGYTGWMTARSGVEPKQPARLLVTRDGGCTFEVLYTAVR
jgi:hypothetical protein